MTGAVVSRWARRFVGLGALFFVAWALVALADVGRRTEVTLLLFGFVLHTVFGKGYSLLPAYFDRDLAVPRAPAIQLPFTAGGTIALAVAGSGVVSVPTVVTRLGAAAWAVGVAIFVGTLVSTVRDNLTGAETGTGEHNADRRAVDRAANMAIPVVLAYLLAGTYELLAVAFGWPLLVGGTMAQISHLLGAGAAALLMFAVGFRLFPRFLVTHPPRALVYVVLPAGAVGPGLIALGLYSGGGLLHAGAALEAVAVVGFAVSYVWCFARSDRRTASFVSVLVAMGLGVLAVALGLSFAVAARPPALVAAHYRLVLAGFLGLTIVGAATRFYPPTVSEWPGASDDAVVIAAFLVGVGLVFQLGAPIEPLIASVGLLCALAGAALYAYLVLGTLYARPV